MRYPAYRSSGKFSWPLVILYVLLGFLSCFLVETVYVYLMGFVSNFILRFLIIVFTLVLMSFVLTFFTRLFRIRSTRAVKNATLLLTLVSFYASRCVYVNLVNEMWTRGSNEILRSPTPVHTLLWTWGVLFTHPGTVFSSLYQILPYGTSSVNGRMITGAWLFILWLAEFLILWIFPVWRTVYHADIPYDEDRKIWLSKHESFTVDYVENYRDVRTELKKGDYDVLAEAVGSRHYYHLKGQESYAILDFYRHKGITGPYVSLTNVKAIQTGPKRLRHRAIVLCSLMDIGDDAARELYERILGEYEAFIQEGSAQKLSFSDRMSALSFSLRRSRKDATASWRGSAGSSARGKARKAEATEKTSDGAYSASEYDTASYETRQFLDEETIHVPHVTPEMEEAYQQKLQSSSRKNRHGQ